MFFISWHPAYWGGSLSLTPGLQILIFSFAVVDLGLAISAASQLNDAPLDESKQYYPLYGRWPIAWFFIYSCLMPAITLVHMTLDFILYRTDHIHPIYVLVVSLKLALSWGSQISVWLLCDFMPIGGVCYQWYLKQNWKSDQSGSLVGVQDGVVPGKFGVGFVIWVFYITYVVFACIAVHRWRRARKG